MRKLSNSYLIETYLEEEVDRDISLEELRNILNSSFSYIKEQMSQEHLPTIRWKYFGTFVVYDARAEYIRDRTAEQLAKGTITEKLYKQRTEMLTNFLNKENNE